MSDTTPNGFADKPFVYVYNPTLNLYDQLTNQIVPLDNDADFILRGIYVVVPTTGTGFSFRFSGPADWYYSTQQSYVLGGQIVAAGIPSACYSNNNGALSPVIPEVVYPAGGKIGVDITNTQTWVGGPNTYWILFVGVKRFAVGE